MYKIVINGINEIAIKLRGLINDSCNVIAFLDDSEYANNYIDGINIINSKELKYIDFDWLIDTEKNLDLVNDNRVIDISEWIYYYYDFQIYRTFNKLYKNNNIDGFITGLSHFQVGLEEQLFNYNIINLATSSQDIFYDFNIGKCLIGMINNKSKIKFAIIGLAYYSFQYDLSKSINKNKSYQYFPFLNTIHNKHDVYKLCDKYMQYENTFSKIFSKNYKLKLYDILKVFDESNWRKFIDGNLNEEKINQGKEFAKGDSKKDFPLTVMENIGILEEYINFLKENNIEPIIVISPHTKYYTNTLSNKIKVEFESIIDFIAKKYNLKVFNYFYSKNFENADFYDVAHLNRKGAKKFSMLLNHEIENLFK